MLGADKTTAPYDAHLPVNATENAAQDSHGDSSGLGLTMPATDIVGVSRPQNVNFDVGAFEVPVVSTAVKDIIGSGVIPFPR